MAHDLVALLGPEGVVRAADLTARVDRHTIARWVATGRLLRLHPGVLALPDRAEQWAARLRAAVLATDGTLSHTTALAVWRVLPPEGPVHVCVAASRRALRSRGLVVHRVQHLVADRLGGEPVTALPRSLVDTWGLASGRGGRPRPVERARAAVIETLRSRRVTAAELRAEVGRHPALPGRRQLAELVTLVAEGCQSELEIWGVHHVLRGAGMPRFVQQYPVGLPFGTVYLDAAVPELKLAVELDGAAFHGSPAAREQDTRRDVALAARGWVVLRFTYRRLTSAPDECRREILAVCAARRAMSTR